MFGPYDLQPVMSISDDDLCADCNNLLYDPGKMSLCTKTLKSRRCPDWPGRFNEDGYCKSCSEFQPTANQEDNWVDMPLLAQSPYLSEALILHVTPPELAKNTE